MYIYVSGPALSGAAHKKLTETNVLSKYAAQIQTQFVGQCLPVLLRVSMLPVRVIKIITVVCVCAGR